MVYCCAYILLPPWFPPLEVARGGGTLDIGELASCAGGVGCCPIEGDGINIGSSDVVSVGVVTAS